MTGIIKLASSSRRKKKPKPNAAQRQLEADWQKMLAAHSKPLGLGTGRPQPTPTKTKPMTTVNGRPVPPSRRPPLMEAATKPVVDPLAGEKRQLAGRVGQSYNKGGLQYLTDDELSEQRSGSHKRRT